MKKFAFTADWHLAPCAWKRSKLGAGDSYEAIKFVVEYCIGHSLPLVAAGDLLDQTVQPDAQTIDVLCECMSKMQEAGLPVYYIQGQHEKSNPPWLSVHAWPKHINQVKMSGWPLAAAFDWQPRQQLKETLASITNKKILIMHQVWQEFVGFEHAYEASFSDIPDCVEYLFTGDHHKHSCASFPRASGKPITVVSPGSLSAQDISEEWQKRFIVVDDLKFSSVKIPSRRIIRETVSGPEQAVELVNRIVGMKDAKLPILEVTVAVSFEGAVEYFDKFDQKYYELMLKYEVPSKIETVIQRFQIPDVAEATDDDYLNAALGGESDLCSWASRLLHAERPDLELADIKKEFFSEDSESRVEECLPASRAGRRVLG